MADTVNMTAGTKYSTVGGGNFKATNTIDFTAAQAANTAAGGGTFAADDIIQCLTIPAGTQVRNVWVKIVTAGSATGLEGDFGVVSPGDPNGFDDAVDLTAAANTVTYGVGGTDALVTAGGVFYSSAGTLDFEFGTVNTVATWPVINVVADCFDGTSL